MVNAEQWLVVGMSYYGDPFQQASGWSADNEIGRLWARFSVFAEKYPGAIKHTVTPDAGLEIHIETDETREKGHFEVFVGVVVDELEDVPPQCSVKVLPTTQYAVFTLKGGRITSDWGRQIYQRWLPSSGFVPAHPYMIEYYDERFKGLERVEESEMDVYVPVKRAEG
jgi:predicted transcriptional regulator YdeE